ncbi:MAG: hypothetical protein ACETWK_01925 [Candidatus Aminicenantaceae bacterium]
MRFPSPVYDESRKKVLIGFASHPHILSQFSPAAILNEYITVKTDISTTFEPLPYFLKVDQKKGDELHIIYYLGGRMLKNYLEIVLRNTRKQKGYSFINI